MEEGSAYLPLLLITTLAVLVPLLVSRLRRYRLPIVVGEILAGILIGSSGLDLVHPNATLKFLADFGFAFLMFLSGLEVDFRMLLGPSPGDRGVPFWKRTLPLASASFFLTILLSVGIGFGMAAWHLTSSPILLGLILSTTSLGIVVPALRERGLTTTRFGQLILVSALISDFVTLLLLGTTIAIIIRGFSLDLFFFLLLLLFFLAATRIGQWMRKVPFLPRLVEELSHATAQIRVRGSFALLVISVVLAEALGVEVILGAFLAGAIVSLSGQGVESQLRTKLEAIGYGFFIPIFFITVGAGFDFRALIVSPAALLLVPILVAAAFVVKIVPALLFRVLVPWRETLAAGALLSARLSLIIAVSTIALQAGIINTSTNSAVILLAIVTCTLSPLLFSRILPLKEKKQREGIVILGTDQLAVLLALRLGQTAEPITIIGRDQRQLRRLKRRGFRSVIGNPDDIDVLERAGLRDARAIVALSNSPDVVLRVCRLSRQEFGVPIGIARADDPDLARRLQSMDVRVVQPAMAVALALEGALHFPTAFGMLLDQRDDVDLLDIPLGNPEFVGRPLRSVRFAGNALVLGIQRQGEAVVPHGDTVLRRGDILVLVGSPDSLRQARAQLETSS